MIMDALSGARQADQERGVRASRFDWTKKPLKKSAAGSMPSVCLITAHREALALATKVAHAPGVMAELCWSDEPDYTAGYVASLQTGYVRFPRLKDNGDQKGEGSFCQSRRPERKSINQLSSSRSGSDRCAR
jgi:6-carboxyhexanoate--CoA ligase